MSPNGTLAWFHVKAWAGILRSAVLNLEDLRKLLREFEGLSNFKSLANAFLKQIASILTAFLSDLIYYSQLHSF